MRHDYIGPIYIPIIGPANWHLTATGVLISADGGTTYPGTGTIVTATATTVTLATGVTGTRCWISVPATSFALAVDTLYQFVVKLTNGADTPVMTAAGRTWSE